MDKISVFTGLFMLMPANNLRLKFKLERNFSRLSIKPEKQMPKTTASKLLLLYFYSILRTTRYHL